MGAMDAETQQHFAKAVAGATPGVIINNRADLANPLGDRISYANVFAGTAESNLPPRWGWLDDLLSA